MSPLAPQTIESADDPRVWVYRNQKDAWLRAQRGETPADRQAGLFMAEGDLVVRTLIDSGMGIHSVLVTEQRLETMRDAFERLPDDVPVFVGSRAVLESIIGFDLHRGVLAAGRRPAAPALPDLLGSISVLLVLEDLCNHDNLGSLFRSLAALVGPGRGGILLSPRCCDPLYRKALRVSMGATLRVRWAVGEPWPACLDLVRNVGFEVFGMTPAEGAEDLGTMKLPPRLAIVLGAEGPGLTPEALAKCDRTVRIPIDSEIDSLNVSVAGAIVLAQLARNPA
jgi:tRNA G18 (ribose-2'-O)-methylase SpoU